MGGNGGAGSAARPANQSSAGGGGGGGGGTAVLITPGASTNSSNQESITGGQGGLGGDGTGFANARAGGGGGGGIGVLFNGDGGLDNTGAIGGGRGGNAGQRRDFAIGNAGGAGGTAVSFESVGRLNNSGNITGGDGGTDGGSGSFIGGSGGRGGDGVSFAGAGSLLNNSGQGRITGGAGGFGTAGGGTGVSFAGSGNVTNSGSGSIFGGRGSDGEPGGAGGGIGDRGGNGGGGVSFIGAGNLVNSGQGVISGGQGGVGGLGVSGDQGGGGGNGGTGLSFAGGGSLDNSGTITGGDGGAGGAGGGPGRDGTTGAGGVGVTGVNLAIINSGTISGGLPGDGTQANRANAITFTGGTNSLELRSGYSFLGRVVDANRTATLIFGGATTAADTTFDVGAIGTGLQYDGFAALQKTGVSTWTLVGTNTAALPTTVQQGTLVVNGALPNAPFTVTGGTLAGTGTIGATSIQSGGTLSPGSAATPYGTLTVNGPLGFAAGSFYNVAINPMQNSRTNVVGATTIQGGTVNVTANQGGFVNNARYTILNATTGVVGTFAGVTTSTAYAFLTPSLTYDANNVFLNILPSNPVMTPGGRQVPNYTTAASTQNQFAVASGLTEAGRQSNGRGRVLTALNQLTVPQARAAFDSLSGEGIAAAQNVANRSTQLFTSAIFDQTTFYAGGGAANSVTLTEPLPGSPAFFASTQPIRELADLPAARVAPVAPLPPPIRTWRAWATGFGGVENISGNGRIGSASQRNDIYGGALGVDYQLTPNYLVGVAVGGSNGDFRVNARGTTGSTTGGHIAIYDLYELGNWYGASSSSFSYFGNQTTRFTSGFGGLGTEQNRGNFNSNEFRSRIEIGRHFASLPAFANLPSIAGFGTVTPFVAIELASLRSNGFTETPLKGGPGLFRLNVSGQSASSAPGFVGLRFQRVTPFGGMVLSPTLQVAYVHEFAPYRNQVGTLASLPGSTFLVDGARPARDAAQVKAGAELALGPHSAIFANFDGEFSGINQLYAGKGGFRYVW